MKQLYLYHLFSYVPESYGKNLVNNEISKSVTKNNKSKQTGTRSINNATKVEDKYSKYV